MGYLRDGRNGPLSAPSIRHPKPGTLSSPAAVRLDPWPGAFLRTGDDFLGSAPRGTVRHARSCNWSNRVSRSGRRAHCHVRPLLGRSLRLCCKKEAVPWPKPRDRFRGTSGLPVRRTSGGQLAGGLGIGLIALAAIAGFFARFDCTHRLHRSRLVRPLRRTA